MSIQQKTLDALRERVRNWKRANDPLPPPVVAQDTPSLQDRHAAIGRVAARAGLSCEEALAVYRFYESAVQLIREEELEAVHSIHMTAELTDAEYRAMCAQERGEDLPKNIAALAQAGAEKWAQAWAEATDETRRLAEREFEREADYIAEIEAARPGAREHLRQGMDKVARALRDTLEDTPFPSMPGGRNQRVLWLFYSLARAALRQMAHDGR